jgi:uncharacterized protein YdeI (YjbR/CyaY-like superfamily)
VVKSLKSSAKPTFFASPSEFRQWLQRNHTTSHELLVGFYKRGSGKPSITWPESVDQALSFGWIDGIRRSIDAASYTIRFTPRKRASTWSKINVSRVRQLTKQGDMQPAGLAAFAARKAKKSGIYSYEQKEKRELSAAHTTRLKANKKAWAFFHAQAPWYQRTAIFWVVSAKQEATRLGRLTTLISDSASGRKIRPLTRKPPGK